MKHTPEEFLAQPEDEKISQIAQAIADEGEVRITIRFPKSLWRRLRNAQTDGRIESINRATIDGTAMLLESLEP